jgi:hypothetical protein
VEDDDDDPEALGPLLKGRPLITFNFADMEVTMWRVSERVTPKVPYRLPVTCAYCEITLGFTNRINL